MNPTPHPPSFLPVSIRSLMISTEFQLHPEFKTSPVLFANRSKVKLVNAIFPETDLKKAPDDRYGDERIEKTKSNIHLVRYGAIRLFVELRADAYWVRSIDLNPAMLRYEVERCPLSKGDLPWSLEILRSQVTPLLANPDDAQHIVPGLVGDKEPVAFWSEVDSEMMLHGIDIRCLHALSHPVAGPAAGVKPDRIQLGDKKDECMIRLKRVKAKLESTNPDDLMCSESTRVRLILKGNTLTNEFINFGTIKEVREISRLVKFTETSIAKVYDSVMSRILGNYLPIPMEWAQGDQGKAVTHAKVLALLSHLTPISIEELRKIDEDLRQPSDSTRKRLKKDIEVEMGRFNTVPVSTLFQSSICVTSPPPSSVMDPATTTAYDDP